MWKGVREEDWKPAALAATLAQGAQGQTPGEFKVVEVRQGEVVLDGGRLEGLLPGMHLVGPRGSKLHVVFDTSGRTATARVRVPPRPGPGLQTGDTVSADPEVFPVP